MAAQQQTGDGGCSVGDGVGFGALGGNLLPRRLLWLADVKCMAGFVWGKGTGIDKTVGSSHHSIVGWLRLLVASAEKLPP
ncbi:MAG: hypothetical protein QW795_08280 [Candidatus Bathyarchaeia archaeon]